MSRGLDRSIYIFFLWHKLIFSEMSSHIPMYILIFAREHVKENPSLPSNYAPVLL